MAGSRLPAGSAGGPGGRRSVVDAMALLGAGGAGGSAIGLTVGAPWWVVTAPFVLGVATGVLGVASRATGVVDKITASRRLHHRADLERVSRQRDAELTHRRHAALTVQFEQMLDALATPDLKLGQRRRLHQELQQINDLLPNPDESVPMTGERQPAIR